MEATEGRSRVLEWPLATREECWRAWRPGQEFSESAFQRLRTKGLLSDGVRVSPRRSGQALGQGRYFSRLNLLALSARRAGETGEWERLRELAGNVERDSRFQQLAQGLLQGHGLVPAPPMAELAGRVRELVTAVCELTDRWQRPLPGQHDRFPATVGRLHGGVADLVVTTGGTCTFAQAKLAGINRGRVGDVVYLYLVDMGGPDELVRVRPAVRVEDRDAVRTSEDEHPGPFDHHVTTVEGAPLAALQRLVDTVDRPGLPDLSGLHWSRDR